MKIVKTILILTTLATAAGCSSVGDALTQNAGPSPGEMKLARMEADFAETVRTGLADSAWYQDGATLEDCKKAYIDASIQAKMATAGIRDLPSQALKAQSLVIEAMRLHGYSLYSPEKLPDGCRIESVGGEVHVAGK